GDRRRPVPPPARRPAVGALAPPGPAGWAGDARGRRPPGEWGAPMTLTWPSPVATARDGVEALIGRTPLIRLRSVTPSLPPGVEIWAKAEFANPGGSVKDRPALAMIEDGERRGALVPGKIILDATSGNTGIAYAMIAAARGYRVQLCVPSNVSPERHRILAAYGAELVLTDPEEGSDGAIREA